MKLSPSIKFRFSPEKALAAITWMVREMPGIDLHTLLKSCYFADKDQLNKSNRPIFGATYRAMPFGPVPLEVYEMAKAEAIWLAELGIDRYPWKLNGFRLEPASNEAPDLSVFSEDDFTSLEKSFEFCRHMSFNARTSATHGADWQAAKLGYMRYEDMLADSEDKQERIEDLRSLAPYMRL